METPPPPVAFEEGALGPLKVAFRERFKFATTTEDIFFNVCLNAVAPFLELKLRQRRIEFSIPTSGLMQPMLACTAYTTGDRAYWLEHKGCCQLQRGTV